MRDNNNINGDFWHNYYKNTIDNINNNSSFSIFIYNNYINEYNNKNIHLKIADLGSGNCRDSLFFSQKGNLCYAIDINGVLNTSNSNCKLIRENVEDVLKSYKLQTLFDVIYMRWFLHAMPYNNSESVFKYAVNNLKPNGLVCIEVRSLNDMELKKNSKYNQIDKSYTTTHKRWLYSIEMCEKLAMDHNCEILYCKEDYFSPNKNTETHNPLLIRIILKKKNLPYFIQSKNYQLYKDILPKKVNRTILCYQHMNIINNIFEKYNIKYVAVAGTILGLNRHGGIIPWDDDIDIGFEQAEWNKLFNVLNLFKKNGLDFKGPKETKKKWWYDKDKTNKTGIKHCHIGVIDCFLMKRKDDYYEGDFKTYCYFDEYKNISKQIFGYTYIYAPLCSTKSLLKGYGEKFFIEGDVNSFHYKNKSIPRFKLNNYDLSYQTVK